MNRIAVSVTIILWAGGASAIEVSMMGDDAWMLEVGLSETDALRVHLDIGADDGNVAFMNAFFDASPLNDGDTAGYEVVGRDFTMERNDGSGWFRAIEWDGDPNIEAYALIAADDEQDYPFEQWGTDGPWAGDVDSIIIHGTRIGEYALYFENRTTVDPGHAARPPQLFDKGSNQHLYANNLDLPGFIHFRNAWKEGPIFDVPFNVRVIPEPGALVLCAAAGCVLAWRRTSRRR